MVGFRLKSGSNNVINNLLSRAKINIGYHHQRPLFCQAVASGSTNTRSAPCDKRDFSTDSHAAPLVF